MRILKEKIPEYVRKDVMRVKKLARIVFKISPDEKKIKIIEKQNPRLNIIAVVGPTWGFGRGWKEALLTEIGISRARPYHEAIGLNRKPGQPHIPARKKWFYLSPYQYQLIAPVIFEKIKGIAFKKVSSWEKGPFSDDPFWVAATWRFWSGREKRFYDRLSWLIATKGARFSISREDRFLLQDIYWAEMNLSRIVRRQVRGLAGYVSKSLNWYKYNYKGKKPFRELKRVQEAELVLQSSSLSRHLLIEAVRLLRDDKERISYFFQHAAEMINWDGQETEERRLMTSIEEHPDLDKPKTRLANIQLRVTTGLDAEKDYIVFEVYPQKK